MGIATRSHWWRLRVTRDARLRIWRDWRSRRAAKVGTEEYLYAAKQLPARCHLYLAESFQAFDFPEPLFEVKSKKDGRP